MSPITRLYKMISGKTSDKVIDKIKEFEKYTKDLHILNISQINTLANDVIEFVNNINEVDLYELFQIDAKPNEDGSNKNNLQILNTQVYGKFLDQLKFDKSPEGRKTLLELFKHISELNIRLGDITELTIQDQNNSASEYSKIEFYNDSAIICKYITTIIEEHFAKNKDRHIEELENYAYCALSSIYQKITDICTNSKGKEEERYERLITKENIDDIGNKHKLHVLKYEISWDINTINQLLKEKQDKDYINKSRHILDDISDMIQEYLTTLLKDTAKEILAPPPCEYTVIRINSVTSKKMTSYPDFQFAILADDENYKISNNPAESLYFKHLTKLAQFKMICSGGIIIPRETYNTDTSILIQQEPNFSLGQTNFLNHINDFTPSDFKKHLDLMMDKTNDVISGENDVIKLCHSNIGQGNLEQFDTDSSKSKQDILLTIQQEVYHMSDKLIYLLGNKFNVSADNSWDILDALLLEGKLSEEVTIKLQKAISFATLLHARSYDGYKYNNIEELGQLLQLDSLELEMDSPLSEFYHIMQVLSKALLNHKENEKFSLKEDDFNNFTDLDKIIICKKLMKWQDIVNIGEQYLQSLQAHAGQTAIDVEEAVIIKHHLGYAYSKLGHYKNALGNQLYVLNIRQEQHQDKHYDLATSMAHLSYIYSHLGQYQEALKYQSDALSIYRELLGDKSYNVASCLNNIGKIYSNLGKYKKAFNCCTKAQKIYKELHQDNQYEIADCLTHIGLTCSILGGHNKALEYHKQALEERAKLLSDIHPDIMTCYNNLGTAYSNLGKYNESLRCYIKGFEISKELFGTNHPSTATSYSNIGSVYNHLGKYETALKYHAKALELNQELLEENHPSIAISFNNIGATYNFLGKYQEALQYHKNALVIQGESLSYNHPEIAASLNYLGYTYDALGQYQDALRCHTIALELNEELFGKNHPSIAISLNNIGTTCSKFGNYHLALKYQKQAEKLYKSLGEGYHHFAYCLDNLGGTYSELGQNYIALNYHKQALKIRKELLGNEHPEIAASFDNIGAVYNKLVYYENAVYYHKKALDMREVLLEENHPDIASSYNNLGYTYNNLGYRAQLQGENSSIAFYKSALNCHQHALEIREKMLGSKHLHVATSHSNIGSIHNRLGNYDEALAHHKQALEIRQELLDNRHPKIATSLGHLGDTFNNLGQYKTASKYKALAKQIKSGDVDLSLLTEGLTETHNDEWDFTLDLIGIDFNSNEAC